jgi:hypothetical protein
LDPNVAADAGAAGDARAAAVGVGDGFAVDHAEGVAAVPVVALDAFAARAVGRAVGVVEGPAVDEPEAARDGPDVAGHADAAGVVAAGQSVAVTRAVEGHLVAYAVAQPNVAGRALTGCGVQIAVCVVNKCAVENALP